MAEDTQPRSRATSTNQEQSYPNTRSRASSAQAGGLASPQPEHDKRRSVSPAAPGISARPEDGGDGGSVGDDVNKRKISRTYRTYDRVIWNHAEYEVRDYEFDGRRWTYDIKEVATGLMERGIPERELKKKRR